MTSNNTDNKQGTHETRATLRQKMRPWPLSFKLYMAYCSTYLAFAGRARARLPRPADPDLGGRPNRFPLGRERCAVDRHAHACAAPLARALAPRNRAPSAATPKIRSASMRGQRFAHAGR